MIVAVSGFSESGKDTVADILVQEGFVKMGFADPIKRIARDVYDFSIWQLWGPSKARNEPDKRYPRDHTFGVSENTDKCVCCGSSYYEERGFGTQCYLTPRYALQLLGTEWGRHCYPNTWVDYALRTAKKISSQHEKCHELWYYDAVKGMVPWPESHHLHTLAEFPTDVIISDTRFKNEIDGLSRAGVKLVRIRRKGYEKPAYDHPSETEQVDIPDSEFDYILDNDQDLDVLATKTGTMLAALK